MTAADPDDRDATAGEYVLGTLDAAEREAFERTLAVDARARAEVYRWQDRLTGLSDRVEAIRPGAATWAAIERRLGPPGAAATGAADPRTATPTAVGGDVIELRRRLRRWQLTGGLGLAASALLATFGVLRGPAPATVRHVAVLDPSQAGGGRWLVEVDERGGLRLAPLDARVELAADRALELWTQPPGAGAPSSLGVVPAGRETRLASARLAPVEPGTLFALSLEPSGGSPTGRPTGPILYAGRTPGP